MWFVLPAIAATTWVVPGDGTLPQVYDAAADDDAIELPVGTISDDLPDIDKRLTIYGQGAGITFLQLPDREPAVRVFVNVTFADLTLDGLGDRQMLELTGDAALTLTRAELTGGFSASEHGGCVQAISGGTSVIATDTTFRACVAAQGGAIGMVSASLTCTGCTFDTNRATNGYGGGGAIWLDGSATATVTDSIFRANTATFASGGAIAVTSAASLTVNGGTFDGNSAEDRGGAIVSRNGNAVTVVPSLVGGASFLNGAATDGGAVACEAFSACPLVLTGASFADQTVTGRGGHVFVELGTATITGSTFERGHAVGRGGAVYIGGGSSLLTVSDSVFSTNDSSDQGGAIFSTAAAVDLLRVAMCDNLAADSGGGAYVELAPSMRVRNSTALRNIAVDSGGALRLNGSGQILQSTFVQNSAGNSGSAIGVRGAASVVGVYGSVLSQQDDAVAVETDPELVGVTVNVDRSAAWGNVLGDYAPNILTSNAVLLTTDPFPEVPTGCETPIPLYGGELSDKGDLIDPDSTPSEIGATGGPDADPALWVSDGDPVPAMWDCEPDSPHAWPGNREIPGDGIDNDCLDGDAPATDPGGSGPANTTEPGDTGIPGRPTTPERAADQPSAGPATGCGCGTGPPAPLALLSPLLLCCRRRRS